jgi:Skp family chaperone for outer membrane proteins
MKKVMLGLMLVMTMCVAASTETVAQAMKIGTFDLENIVSLMPGTDKIDSMLQSFMKDSVNAEYELRV